MDAAARHLTPEAILALGAVARIHCVVYTTNRSSRASPAAKRARARAESSRLGAARASGPAKVNVSLLRQVKRIVSPKLTKAGRYVFHSKMTKDQMPDDSMMTYRIVVA